MSAKHRAGRLLRDVMGAELYQELYEKGEVRFPSSLHPGYVYSLATSGTIMYGRPERWLEAVTLCVQPCEQIPQADMVATNYLLITADEARLHAVANKIVFGLASLMRALYLDFASSRSSGAAIGLTCLIVGFFLLSPLGEGALFVALGSVGWGHIFAAALFLLPALVGLVLYLALLVDICRALRLWASRSSLGSV